MKNNNLSAFLNLNFKISLMLFNVILFLSCKKEKSEPPKEVVMSITPSEVTLAKDKFMEWRLELVFENFPNNESKEVIWHSENPKIASVNKEGVVSSERAGITYVVATLISGKVSARCKVTVTDANSYKYRILLKDKGVSDFSISNPKQFLSDKAIERRRKRNIPIDDLDLPISSDYIKAIQKVGGVIVAKSKWLNAVSVHLKDEALIDEYMKLPFVKEVIMVWDGKDKEVNTLKYVDAPQVANNSIDNIPIDYGVATANIAVNNGQVLHNLGFKGKGIDIAVIDAGFINLKSNPSFNNINIKGAKSFIYEDDNPYGSDSHGVWVASCMAVNKPGVYVGTAPEANYWLFRTEDQSSEHLIEQDYWVSAAEYADSVGVDLINSSLYYGTGYYSPPEMYRYETFDGKTHFATRGANVAFKKGIFIVNCAGNDQTWVGTPADSPSVLTVGSVNSTLQVDNFSSWGKTVDGRIKPDVMAKGGGAYAIGVDGASRLSFGTSYASPIVCGLVACLWQAYPSLSNIQLMDIMRKSGDRYNAPELHYGYGIVDMSKAIELSKAL